MPMSIINLSSSGSFEHVIKFLEKIRVLDISKILNKYGKLGVSQLEKYTPKRTGLTASSWTYDITYSATHASVSWHNTNINDGVQIAMLIQYGHGTRNGGYVQGIDYINPALEPIFSKMADDAWEEIKNA